MQANDPVEYVTATMRRHPYNGSVIPDMQNGDDRLYDYPETSNTSKGAKGIKKKMKGFLSTTISQKPGAKLTNSELTKHNMNSASSNDVLLMIHALIPF